ncbi:hypothetical protein DNHGIG_14710 [Collibacillus ludicampi]|uniref:HTH cro/C1-type domain-containing protein n=1 Tax=Collibacillus ludicampi TaxID=2771369 RepID=A0AAV4LDJ6_9BACL|nr:helix-turn-helix transcriptional regulator [Collibacillus ludicampi]GIM45922.1 hypothetical protein DNHGIG_14710 [Collibacillus ludicampi]
MSLGQRIKVKRKEKKLTQLDVARKLGIDNTTVSKWESDVYEPDADNLAKLANLLEVTTDYLLTGRTDPDKETVQDPIPPEEREFLEWVKNNLEGTFFYDFSRAPEEQKRDMMKSLRIIWELEKHRKPGQKQGE